MAPRRALFPTDLRRLFNAGSASMPLNLSMRSMRRGDVCRGGHVLAARDGSKSVEPTPVCRVVLASEERTGSEPMPIILWLLGVPLGLVIVLFLLGVV
jgi:hypothetical protein